MKLGLVAPGPPLDRLSRRARHCEEVGYDGLWVTSHFMGWVPDALWKERFGSAAGSPHDALEPAVHLGVLAASTERAVLGTMVTDPATRHPALLAHTFSSLHALAPGRVILGLGAGEAANTEPYGIPLDRPATRLEEAVEVIDTLARQGEVSFDGRVFRLERAVVGYPSEERFPIWIGAHGPRLLRLTGTHCDGWLPGPLLPEDYAAKRSVIETAAASVGRPPGAVTRGMFGYVLPCSDAAAARAMLRDPLVRTFALPLGPEVYEAMGERHPLDRGGMTEMVPNRYSLREVHDALERVPDTLMERLFFHGAPEDLTQQMRAYSEAGVDVLNLVNLAPLADPAASRRSFEILDELVAGTGADRGVDSLTIQ